MRSPLSFLAVHGSCVLLLAALAAASVGCVVKSNQADGPPDATPTTTVPPGPPPGPTGPANPPTDPTTPGGGTTPPGGDTTLSGTWSSPSCGTRTYERKITFNPDGTFTSQDLVSPCPPGTQCVWSGIVNRQGNYAVTGSSLTLRPNGASPPQGQPLPTNFTLEPNSKAPVEPGNGVAPCVYRRTP